jgi:hypothetical protein
MKLESTQYFDFTTCDPKTGQVGDADSTPTAQVFEESTDTPITTPTVTKRTGQTGNYRVPVYAHAADGYEVGKTYNLVVSATVSTVTQKAVVASFIVTARGLDDVSAAVWATVMETGFTAQQAILLLSAVMAGKSSGGGTVTVRFRDLNDTKDRIVATVDANGNRTAITRDAT